MNLFFRYIKLIIYFLFLTSSLPLYALTIEDTIKNTVKNNLTVKIGLEEISEARESINSALGEYKPDINISLTEKFSSTETTTSSSSTTEDKTSDTYSLIVNQNIYDGGKKSLELERSKIILDKQVQNFYISLNNLILDAINGYLTVQVYEKILEATKKNHQVISRIYNDTVQKEKLGTASYVELINAESSYELSKSNLIMAEGNLEVGKNTFYRISGIKPIDLNNIINLNKEINEQNIIKNSLKNNNELNVLKLDYKDAQLQLDIKKRDKLPSFDLTGDLSYNDNVTSKGTETKSGSISAKLSIPIYQQGIVNSDIKKLTSNYLKSEYKIEDKKDSITLDISLLLNDYEIYNSQLKSNLTQIKAHESSLELIKNEYESGMATFTNLIDQEEKLLNSRLAYIEKNKDLIMTYFRILSLEGELLNIFKDYLPNIN